MTSTTDDDIDLLEVFATFWRRKYTILFFALLFGVLGAAYVTQMVTPYYTSGATVAVEESDAPVPGMEALVGGMSTDQSALNTEVHLIKSRQLLRRLVDQESLLEDPEFNPDLIPPSPYSLSAVLARFRSQDPVPVTQDERVRRAVDLVRKRLTVNNPRQSLVLEIMIETTAAEKSARLANTIADLYINDQVLYKEQQANVATKFLKDRASDLQSELGEAELAVKDFAASRDILAAEELALRNRQVADNRARIQDLTARLQGMTDNVDRLRGLDPAALSLNDAVAAEALAAARQLRQGGAANDVAAALSADIETAQRQADQVAIQIEALRSAVAATEDEVATQSRDLLRFQQLQREAEAVGELYLFILTRMKEAEVQQGTQKPDARLISLAVTPLSPTRPRKALTVAMALALGAAVGVGIALLREAASKGIKSGEDLEQLTGLPVLGQIPTSDLRRRRDLLPLLKRKDTNAFSEAIRNLRTSVLLSKPDKPPQIILLASSIPAEGKTTTAIALAQSLGGMGGRVLLMEIDIRRLTLAEYLGDNPRHTLIDVTEGKVSVDEAAQQVDGLKFSVLQGGKSTLNAADFFSSQAFQDTMAKLRASYDHVVLDAPPILPVSDSRIVGQYVDAILYACAWNSTPPAVIRSGLSEFKAAGLEPDGMILTKIDVAKASEYGGSYHKSYGRGYYG